MLMGKRYRSEEDKFYAEMKVVSVNVESAKDVADQGSTQEAHHCLDLAEAHLIYLQAETQVKIERRDSK
jgi:hypothetical protein